MTRLVADSLAEALHHGNSEREHDTHSDSVDSLLSPLLTRGRQTTFDLYLDMAASWARDACGLRVLCRSAIGCRAELRWRRSDTRNGAFLDCVPRGGRSKSIRGARNGHP
ncbi:hypothetical protein NDU88_008558 [Pleurodeles waltl]|uniref:Uncharacterized protein n=1 Tax=Pleurodeles waltl TaxID=8319 RepID=A0AAV7RXZ8_PLEWA|nr:hypothetical protein NDU88_008558 [Pleurodeles waltl]